MDDTPTRALQARSKDLLAAGLVELLRDGEEQWVADQRDLMVVLAPYHDCAMRLGLDTTAFFEEAANSAPKSLQEVVARFGHRNDITPDAFGFAVVENAEGPRYVWL